MLKIEEQYRECLNNILNDGYEKPVFGSKDLKRYSLPFQRLHHSWEDGLPIYSGKKVNWKWAITEMIMFLQNKPISWLQEQGISIWDQWNNPEAPIAYHNMSDWNGDGIDQTAWVLDGLVKSPFRNSYVVSGWNPSQIYEMAIGKSVEIPCCHLLHQLLCYEKGILNMMVLIRSNDMGVGNPFNVAQYGLLLEAYCLCLSNRTGEKWTPGEIDFYISDAHIYGDKTNLEVDGDQFHGVRKYLAATPKSGKVQVVLENRGQVNPRDFQPSDFRLVGYEPEKFIKMPQAYRAGGFIPF